MTRSVSIAGVALLASGVAWAHFPMAIAPAWKVAPGQPLVVEYTNGHPFRNDRHAVPRPERVTVHPYGQRPVVLTDEVSNVGDDDQPIWRMTYTPRRPGDCVISIHGGLFREPPQRTVADYTKLVVHVADESGAQVGWHRVLGDPLEILPLTRPYCVPVGAAFRGQVLQSGEPTLEMIVEAETYAPGEVRHDTGYLPRFRLAARCDDQGVFVITLPQAGWWLISSATDGGSGEQGTSPVVAHRATLWVHVGDTEFDRPTVGGRD